MESIHSLQEHCRRVNSLCRICGERVVKRQQKKRYVSKCEKHAADLHTHHSLDISSDEDGKHPTGMCIKCYKRLWRCKHEASGSASTCNTSTENAACDINKMKQVWTAFNPNKPLSECGACCHFNSHCKAGRPKKVISGACKINMTESDHGVTLDSISTALLPTTSNCMSTPQKRQKTVDMQTSPIVPKSSPPGIPVDIQTSPIVPKSSPPGILADAAPVDLQTSPIVSKSSPPGIPVDMQTSPIVSKSSTLGIPADAANSLVQFRQKQSLRDIQEIQAPLSPQEENYLAHLVHIKMQESGDKVTVRCKTRGQPIILKKMTNSSPNDLLLPFKDKKVKSDAAKHRQEPRSGH